MMILEIIIKMMIQIWKNNITDVSVNVNEELNYDVDFNDIDNLSKEQLQKKIKIFVRENRRLNLN